MSWSRTRFSAPCTSLPEAGGTSLVPVSAVVERLSANTTYHFRVVASNQSGTRYGSDLTFTTLANPPQVQTNVRALTAAVAYEDEAAFTKFLDGEFVKWKAALATLKLSHY